MKGVCVVLTKLNQKLDLLGDEFKFLREMHVGPRTPTNVSSAGGLHGLADVIADDTKPGQNSIQDAQPVQPLEMMEVKTKRSHERMKAF